LRRHHHALNGPKGTRYDGAFVADDHVHLNQRGHDLVAALLERQAYTQVQP
jgi:hypothetical protein